MWRGDLRSIPVMDGSGRSGSAGIAVPGWNLTDAGVMVGGLWSWSGVLGSSHDSGDGEWIDERRRGRALMVRFLGSWVLADVLPVGLAGGRRWRRRVVILGGPVML